MRVVHIGPPLARLGGPAGYLHELHGAAQGRDTRGHEVLFPPLGPPRPAVPPASPAAPARGPSLKSLQSFAGSLKRRLLGPPRQYRPPLAELRERGGRIHRMMEETGAQVVAEAAASLETARQGGDVLFAHDVFTAAHLLEHRQPGQKVWMLAHAPFPMALYLVWSWGTPEQSWEEILALHDVAAWVERELSVWERVDRLILPCREAGDELIRCDPRFAAPLARADWLLTGAAGPALSGPPETSRARWGLPERGPVGLYLGNAQPYRGLDALLAAFPLLSHGVPGVVAVAGPAPESLPRHPRLRALGRVADVASLLRAVDFVVNVNRFSLFDLSTIEATEAGRPLLLHATGGNRTFQDLGAGCVMIPDLAPETVARGLTAMLSLPPERRDELGRASRACYEEHLTPAHLWRRHLDLYDRNVC